MMVLDHFQYNVAFDKSTFSLDPPEGYSLQRMQ
jgi:outer membrane lipoprotein-sorting protein